MPSEKRGEKNGRKSPKKILIYIGHRTRFNPLNATSNGRKLNEERSIYALGLNRHCQLTARIDGIDRDFLFGNARFPQVAPGVQPLPLAFGALTGEQGPGPWSY